MGSHGQGNAADRSILVFQGRRASLNGNQPYRGEAATSSRVRPLFVIIDSVPTEIQFFCPAQSC
jgi:hypothetical protein